MTGEKIPIGSTASHWSFERVCSHGAATFATFTAYDSAEAAGPTRFLKKKAWQYGPSSPPGPHAFPAAQNTRQLRPDVTGNRIIRSQDKAVLYLREYLSWAFLRTRKSRAWLAVESLVERFIMSQYATNLAGWLRLPVLASSGLAVVASSLLYFKQNEIIYPRNLPPGSRSEVPTPKHFGVSDCTTHHIPTPDGETLHAYFLPAPKSPRSLSITILTFHGNAGNIGHRLPIGKVLQESLLCNVLMLEYRGYGHSTGTPDENGLMIDAQTGLDWVRKNAKDTKVVVYGQSLGGAVSIRLVKENSAQGDIAALMLENTFTSIRKMIPAAFPPARYLARLCHQYWPSEEIIPQITNIPILFLSGLKDEIVPPAQMQELFRASKAKTKIWKSLPEGHHNDTVAEDGYFDAIWRFLTEEVADKSHSEKGTGAVDWDETE